MKKLFPLLFITTMAFAQEKMNLDEMAKKAVAPLIHCPEKVWPGYQPNKNSRFVLIEPSTNRSVTIDENGLLKIGSAIEWGDEGLSAYNFGIQDDIKTLTLNIEEWSSQSDALETFFHEGFHYLGQKNTSLASRNSTYPFDFQGRSAKAMQLKRLHNFIQYQDPQELKLANYWEKWIKENRKSDWEFNQAFDVLEGSAEYVGKKSLAISQLGCHSSKKEIINEIIKSYTPHYLTLEKDSQSYESGLFGYLYADLIDNSEVFKTLDQSPISQILNQEAAASDEMDPNFKNIFEFMESRDAEMIGKSISEIDSSNDLLAIPTESQVGVFSGMGFIEYEKYSGATLIPNFSAFFKQDDKTLQLENASVLSKDESACAKRGVYLVPLNDSIKLSKDWKLVESSNFLGKKVWCLE